MRLVYVNVEPKKPKEPKKRKSIFKHRAGRKDANENAKTADLPTHAQPIQPIPKEQEEIIKYKTPPRPTFGYYVLKSIFATITFLIIYMGFILVEYERGFMQFFLIFVTSLMVGVLGSLIARSFVAYWEGIIKTGQELNRALVGSLLYACIVFFGLYGFIMARYEDITAMSIDEFLFYLFSSEFIELVIVLILIKIFIYLLSDSLSSRMAIGA
jgi:hypothetical protein